MQSLMSEQSRDVWTVNVSVNVNVWNTLTAYLSMSYHVALLIPPLSSSIPSITTVVPLA